MIDAGPGVDWYATFLPLAIPAGVGALAATPVDTDTASPAHRLRAGVVDLFGRLPPTEALRAHADAVCGACVAVFGAGDAEEIAAAAARAALDMHKAFRPALEVGENQPKWRGRENSEMEAEGGKETSPALPRQVLTHTPLIPPHSNTRPTSPPSWPPCAPCTNACQRCMRA